VSALPTTGKKDGRAIAHTNSKTNGEKALGQMISPYFPAITAKATPATSEGPNAM
jgi:hypothetical protein